jgi:hypothetical protein
MNASAGYFLDVILGISAIFFVINLLYGRIKRKALIGGYKPGVPGYEAFSKWVNSNRNLTVAVVVAIFFIVNAIFDARKILEDPNAPTSLLVVAPVMVVLAFFIIVLVLPKILIKR